MNILIINTIPFEINGISNVILSHILSLSETKDVQISLAYNTRIDQKYVKEFQKKNVNLIKMPNRDKEIINYILNLRKITKSNNFDFIHIHGNSGTMIFETLGVYKKIKKQNKIILHSHNTLCNHNILFGPNSIATKIMKKKAYKLVACSNSSGDWLYKKDYITINNAVKIEQFIYNVDKRNKIRNQYKIKDNDYVIGHVGFFNSQKNHQFLIKIFNQYLKINSNAKLFLFGEGSLQEECKKMADNLGIASNILFFGKKEDVYNYYSAMDLFVFPSLWEGFPVTLIEAQANGLPVLCSDIITKEIKINENVYFESLDNDEFIWSKDIVELSKTYRENIEINYKRLNDFDYQSLNKRLKDLYR